MGIRRSESENTDSHGLDFSIMSALNQLTLDVDPAWANEEQKWDYCLAGSHFASLMTLLSNENG